jgi:hypothetical protein
MVADRYLRPQQILTRRARRPAVCQTRVEFRSGKDPRLQSKVLLNAVTGEVELYDIGYRYSTSSDGGTSGGLETVD